MFLIRTHHDAKLIADLQHHILTLREDPDGDQPYVVFHLPVVCHHRYRSGLLGSFVNHASFDVVTNRAHAPTVKFSQQEFSLPFLLPTRLIEKDGRDAFFTQSYFRGDYPTTKLQPHYTQLIARILPKAHTEAGILEGSQLRITEQELLAAIVYQFLYSNMRDKPYGVTAHQTKVSRYLRRRSWSKLFKAL